MTSLLLGLPILAPSFATAIRPIDQEPMETYGWRGFARQVADAANGMPAGTVVLTGNYGEAGALETFGPGVGLDIAGDQRPQLLGHLGDAEPRHPDSVLAGHRRWHRPPAHRVATRRARCTGSPCPMAWWTRETDGDAAIYRCSDPKGTWSQLWPRLSHIG